MNYIEDTSLKIFIKYLYNRNSDFTQTIESSVLTGRSTPADREEWLHVKNFTGKKRNKLL